MLLSIVHIQLFIIIVNCRSIQEHYFDIILFVSRDRVRPFHVPIPYDSLQLDLAILTPIINFNFASSSGPESKILELFIVINAIEYFINLAFLT